MCGRFNITDTPGLKGLLDHPGMDLQMPEPRYNIAPTEDILLLHEGRGDPARWWLVPSWAKEVSTRYSMFNARVESLTKSTAFRGPFRRQRGVVPMSSFIEWRPESNGKQPWVITNDEQIVAVAALWDVWEGGDTPLLSCTLVTTEAAPEFRPWHNRRPVMLTREEFLEPQGMSQAEFARRIGWTKARLNELIRGKRGITAEAALDLADTLGTSPKLWMNLQATYDLDKAATARRIG